MPRTAMTVMKNYVAALALVLATAFAGSSTARAAEVPFVIGSTGLFNAPDPDTVIGTRTVDSLNGLTFRARDIPYFGGTTVDGTLRFQLGTFSLDDRPVATTGASFTLGLLFYTPLGITGSRAIDNSATATAAVAGSTTGAGAGVRIDFDNAPMRFSFLFRQGSEPSFASGSFAVVLDDLFVVPGGSAPITGTIVDASQQFVTAIPEPAPAVLLGAGLLVVLARRHRPKLELRERSGGVTAPEACAPRA
jgi:hypothetical protein